ncbi:response regulator [Paenibacillus sp. D51F]
MIKVAVVDDEEKIRLGLARIIERTSSAYSIVGVWGSAREALSRLEESGADLLITDIRMPQMDGLQLAAELRSRGSAVHIAILSGHNDFNYAREALRCGVEDYLLKPVNQEELERLLERVEGKVGEQRGRQPVQPESLLELMLSADSSRIPRPVWQSACDQLDELPLIRGLYAFMVLHVLPELDGEELRRAAAELRRDSLALVREGGNVALLIGLRKGDHADTARELAVTLLGRLPISLEARIGTGGVYSGGSGLGQAYREAEAACHSAWYAPSGQPVAAYAPAPQRQADPEPLRRWLDNAKGAVKAGDLDGASVALDEWIREAGKLRMAWSFLVDAAAEAAASMEEGLTERKESASHSMPQPGSFPEWQRYAAALREIFQEGLRRVKDQRHESRSVETVKAYLHEHYSEELDLQTLADLVHLTPSYLSKLFKSETGETITDYAISVRIEQAKKLLKERPELKTYEVGELSGYTDPAYFTKAFKRATGKTPKEYRDSAR